MENQNDQVIPDKFIDIFKTEGLVNKYESLVNTHAEIGIPTLFIDEDVNFNSEHRVAGFDPIGYTNGCYDYGLWGYLPFKAFRLVTSYLNTKYDVTIVLLDEEEQENSGEFKYVISFKFFSPSPGTKCITCYQNQYGKFESTLHRINNTDAYLENLINKEDVVISHFIRILQRCLLSIHAGCKAKLCIISNKQKVINRKRIAKGKKPLYEEKMISIKPSTYYKSTGVIRGWRPASEHRRRGHFRTLKSGRTVWVRDCKVSEGSLRKIDASYIFEYSEQKLC